MSIERRGKDLEDRVAAWLTQQGAQFARDVRDESLSTAIDFLVLAPVPFAIEVRVATSSALAVRKGKRLLAQRVVLAERFSKALPLLLIVDQLPQATRLSFLGADLTLEASELPPLTELKERLRPDPFFSSFLMKGDPGFVTLTEPDDLESQWRECLSPVDIVEGRWHEGTIAHEARGAFSTLRERSVHDASLDRLQILPPFMQILTETVDARVSSVIGGRRLDRKKLDTSIGPISLTGFWESNGKRQLLIRTMYITSSTAVHKVGELRTDAWLGRAFGGVGPREAILMVCFGETPSGSSLQSRDHIRLDRRAVNQLESAGWRVFPWDFATPQPAFMTYLSSLR